MSKFAAALLALLVCGVAADCADVGATQLDDRLPPALDHPAIEYYNYLKHPARDPVAELKHRLEAGKVQLAFDRERGYLSAVLNALDVPPESQMAVFSKTSFQEARIDPSNPRMLFFNDSVAVGSVHGGLIELAAQDPEQGVAFYTIEQQSAYQPAIMRRDDCLQCHRSELSLGVPGMILRSFYTLPDGRPKLILGAFTTDHRSPFDERWGGWFVTGSMEHAHTMGNAMLADPDNPESLTPAQTQSAISDIAALLVFNHQAHMMNLITRVGWEVRRALYDKPSSKSVADTLRDTAAEFVDYVLFVDEAPLPGPVHVKTAFAEKFAAEGPRARSGQSLRQFDLKTRLFRYPCSYMIYSAAFDALPEQAKAAIYQRMWQVLSGKLDSGQGSRYSRLSPADRQAIIEILRETKPGLPSYFHL